MTEVERTALGAKTRFQVLHRDGFTCRYCGRGAPNVVLHIDHLDPISNGGGNDESNLITACVDCNLGKGQSLVEVGNGLSIRLPLDEVRDAVSIAAEHLMSAFIEKKDSVWPHDVMELYGECVRVGVFIETLIQQWEKQGRWREEAELCKAADQIYRRWRGLDERIRRFVSTVIQHQMFEVTPLVLDAYMDLESFLDEIERGAASL